MYEKVSNFGCLSLSLKKDVLIGLQFQFNFADDDAQKVIHRSSHANALQIFVI